MKLTIDEALTRGGTGRFQVDLAHQQAVRLVLLRQPPVALGGVEALGVPVLQVRRLQHGVVDYQAMVTMLQAVSTTPGASHSHRQVSSGTSSGSLTSARLPSG